MLLVVPQSIWPEVPSGPDAVHVLCLMSGKCLSPNPTPGDPYSVTMQLQTYVTPLPYLKALREDHTQQSNSSIFFLHKIIINLLSSC